MWKDLGKILGILGLIGAFIGITGGAVKAGCQSEDRDKVVSHFIDSNGAVSFNIVRTGSGTNGVGPRQ